MKLVVRLAFCGLSLLVSASGGCAAGRGAMAAGDRGGPPDGPHDFEWISTADGPSSCDADVASDARDDGPGRDGHGRDSQADRRVDTWPVAGYRYRVPVRIVNAADALADYQVRVTWESAARIAAGQLRADCADILPTASNGAAPLRHWLQGGCNSAATSLWVRVPTLAARATATIYLYYGNSTATSQSNFGDTFVAVNSGFELDAVGVSQDAITHWSYGSGTTGENGELAWPIVAGSRPCDEAATVSDAARQSGSKALRLMLKNCNTGGSSDALTRAAVQKVELEGAWRAMASGPAISLWLSEVTFSTSARWRWHFSLALSDGKNTTWTSLVCRDWGNGEGCGTGDGYDRYNQTATGSDGKTWKRYSVTVPATSDQTSLVITLGHLQDTWDGTAAQSAVFCDGWAGFALRKFRSPEPTATVGTAETRP